MPLTIDTCVREIVCDWIFWCGMNASCRGFVPETQRVRLFSLTLANVLPLKYHIPDYRDEPPSAGLVNVAGIGEERRTSSPAAAIFTQYALPGSNELTEA